MGAGLFPASAPAGTRGAGMTNNRNRYSAATFLGCTAAL